MKNCKTCCQQKPLDEFYAHPGTTDGLNKSCKPCFRVISRERMRIRNSNRPKTIRKPRPNATERILAELRKGPRSARQIAFELDLTDIHVKAILRRLRKQGLTSLTGESWTLRQEVAA